MKSKRNILITFILNLAFSVFELFGGLITGSIAIISDAVHDAGDALSIGISYLCEKKSKQNPDEKYTYGYVRYSVLGAAVNTVILIIGSLAVVMGAGRRLLSPMSINCNGMILLALIGIAVNSVAVYLTHGKGSLNQKAVMLHMIEDLLGWISVLLGSVIIYFTGFTVIDPIMSVGIAVFILTNAAKNLKESLDILLEKAPCGLDSGEVKKALEKIDGITDVHHIHLWSMDGQNAYVTLHAVTEHNGSEVKNMIRENLIKLGISHVTIELEYENEHCLEKKCIVHNVTYGTHTHHH